MDNAGEQRYAIYANTVPKNRYILNVMYIKFLMIIFKSACYNEKGRYRYDCSQASVIVFGETGDEKCFFDVVVVQEVRLVTEIASRIRPGTDR